MLLLALAALVLNGECGYFNSDPVTIAHPLCKPIVLARSDTACCVMAPDDYVLPFSDGGLISLRALALEVKNPGITKADGEDVWLNNFRNTFFTQYGIVQDSFKLRVGLAVLLVDHLNAVTEVQLFGTGNTRASTGLTFTNTSVPAGALLAGSLNSHLLPHSTGGAWHAVGPPPIHDAADPVANRFSFIDSQRRTLEAAI